MRRALIIGYGNPLRGDDGFGRQAARRLRERLSLPGLQVIESHQLTPEMAEAVSESELTIFIDANANAEPGQLSFIPLDMAPPEPPSLTHHVTAHTLLRLAEAVYGRRPAAYMLSAGGAGFAFDETLSPAAEAALEKAVKWVCDVVQPPPCDGGPGHPEIS